MNKKLLALLLAILMVAMSAVAMANDVVPDEVPSGTSVDATGKTITVTKNYNGAGKAGATFVFEVTPDASTSPALETPSKSVTFTTSSTVDKQDVSFTMPGASAFKNVPGEYWYTLTEVVPTEDVPQGVTYNTGSVKVYHVSVTVYNKTETAGADPQYDTVVMIHEGSTTGTKNSNPSFVNSYESHDLTVTKKLAGNGADMNDKFEINVTFTPADTTADGISYALTNAITTQASDGVTVKPGTNPYSYTITGIGHNGTVTFKNIPTGAKYSVSETVDNEGKVSGYVPTYEGCTGSMANADISAVVTNTRTVEVDTGVSTDTMPYILLMAFVAILAVAFVAKKRSVNE